MNDAEIERHLNALAAPVLPPDWKAGILAAARSPSRGSGIERIGWAALAATWLLIVTLHLTTPFVAPPGGPAVSGGEVAEHWRQVRRYAALPPLTADEQAPARIHLEQELILPLRPRS